MNTILGLVLGLVIGGIIGYFLIKQFASKESQAKIDEANKTADLTLQEAKLTAKRVTSEAESKAENLVQKAELKNEQIKNQKIQEAREKFNQFKAEFETQKAKQLVEMKDREVSVVAKEAEFKAQVVAYQKDVTDFKKQLSDLEQREAELESIRENLNKQLTIVSKRKEELDAANELRIKELERVGQLSEQEAKEQLLEAVRGKAENESMIIMKEAISQAQANANKEAKKIVIQSIQRMSAEFAIENTVSVFNIDSDELKGQIIGREGRNIRALEAATGAEIIVDDTPEAIVISSFDPVRREIARLALKKLVTDGRIHPARIEEVVAKTKNN